MPTIRHLAKYTQLQHGYVSSNGVLLPFGDDAVIICLCSLLTLPKENHHYLQ